MRNSADRLIKKWSINLVELLSRYSWIPHLLVFGAYIYLILTEIYNVPKAMDDVKFFLYDTSSHFIDESNDLVDRIQFFFSVSNWPHPQITGRLFALVSYYGLGEINFRFLLIIGHFLCLVMSWSLIRCSELRFNWESLPITFFFLIPIPAVFNWPIAILGFYPSILFAFLTYYHIYKNRKGWAILFILLVTFSGGTGFLVVLPAIFLMLIQKEKRLIRTNLYLLFAFIGAFVVYSHLTINWNFKGQGNEMGGLHSLNGFIRAMNFTLALLASSFQRIYHLNTVQLFIAGLFSVLGYFTLFVMDLKKKRILLHFPLHALILYLMGISFIAGIIRSNPLTFFQGTFPRYENFSITFITCLLILVIKQASYSRRAVHLKLSLVLLVTIHFVVYLDLPRYPIAIKRYLTNTFKELVVTPSWRDKEKVWLSDFINSGTYSPPYEIINPVVGFEPVSDLPDAEMSTDTTAIFLNFKEKDFFTYFVIKSKLNGSSYNVVLSDTSRYWISKTYNNTPDPFRNHVRVLVDRRGLCPLSGQFRLGVLINSKNPRLILSDSLLSL